MFQEYFNKLNAQKHGSGAAAFKFLEEQSVQTSKAPILGVDTGFSEQQLLGIENDEIVCVLSNKYIGFHKLICCLIAL